MREDGPVVHHLARTAWPVDWDAVWVGALASIGAVILFNLIGTGVGAYKAGADARITYFSDVDRATVAFAVFASFLAFVVGGWVAAQVGAVRTAESAMLHGAVAFIVATVVLIALASLGGPVLSGWYIGLSPSGVVPEEPGEPVNPFAARIAANGALAGAAALLLGVAGSVVGGWAGSGERMSLSRYRTREQSMTPRPVPSTTGIQRRGGEVILILLWLLGIPLGLIIPLFLLGIGR